MKLKIAGGCGEYGRNCFLVRNHEFSFLVDCGIMAEEGERGVPHLTEEEIRALRYVFLTHSHVDHSGAVPWLYQHGFLGTVIASRETFSQLPYQVYPKFELESMYVYEKHIALDGLTFEYGRSGHCIGSVWYHFFCENGSILFSGDYTENTQLYHVDPIRGKKADLAIIDCAYGSGLKDYEECCTNIIQSVAKCKNSYRAVVFPVPKYGRGLEILELLVKNYPQFRFSGDTHFIKQVVHIPEHNWWINGFKNEVECIDTINPTDIVFVSDPQLKSIETQKMVLELIHNKGIAIITGNVEKGTLSDKLLNECEALQMRYPVHLNKLQYFELLHANDFNKTIPFHTREVSLYKEIFI